MFKIGNITIKNKIGLAPMSGISNPAYMKICEEMGAGWVVTELISSEAIVRNNKKTMEMLKGLDKINIPVGVQIFGSSAENMAKSAKIICNSVNISFIDINMGCPVPKVAIHSKSGSALLKEPNKVKEIVSAVVSSIDKPVTVKIRSGWDSNSINAIEIAKICEEAGASAICIHGRTRSQGYSGNVDLDIIRKVKENVSIPVIGNGDIKDIESATKMLEYTKVDAIMIGRALLGNPWLIKKLVAYFDKKIYIKDPTYIDKLNMCKHHLEYLLEIKSEKISVLEMRSHISWYIKGLPKQNEIKQKLFTITDKESLIKLIEDYKLLLDKEINVKITNNVVE